VQVVGTEAELFDLVARAGGQLRGKLGVTPLSQHEQAEVGAMLPKNIEAARLYSEGLARLRRLDAPGAREQLERAVALEPEHALLHSALGEAYGQLGYATQARDEAQRALDLSRDLYREDKLLVEARYRESTGEWERASQIYLSLLNFFPDHLEYGLRLAQSLAQAGRPADALDLTERLRKLPPPAGEDPRIDLVEAQAAEGLPDLQRAHAAAVRAATKAGTSGRRLLAGRALLEQASAEVFLGEQGRALSTIVAAKRLLAEAGDRAGVAEALEIIATRLHVRGDTVAAIKLEEEAATIFEDSGNLGRQSLALARLGYWLLSLGHPDQGQARLAEAERAAVTSRERLPLTVTRMYRGHFVTFEMEGQLAVASNELEETSREFREMPVSDWSIDNLLSRARLLREQGDLEAATRILHEALSLTQRGSLRLPASLGLVLLAETSLVAGRIDDAEHQARHALSEMLREGGLPPRQARAHAALAGALLAQGKLAEARQEAAQAASLAAQTDNLIYRLPALAATARVLLTLGQPDDLAEARTLLADGLAAARRGRFFAEQLALRLVLGELTLKADPASGRTQLRAVAHEAEARGFGLVARRARQALR
jgi:tetratricopeptide (TPR) repeat protein